MRPKRPERLPAATPITKASFPRRSLFGAIAIAVLLVGIVATVRWVSRKSSSDNMTAGSSSPPATFVGTHACGECHHQELAAWTSSHHQLAMEAATDATVLGDFKDVKFASDGITANFSRRGEDFMVRTDG